MSALSRLLAQSNHDGLPVRKIAELAEARGHKVSPATVAVYLNGSHGTPTDQVLEAFAAVLPVSLVELRLAAQLAPDYGRWEPPAEAKALSPVERQALETIIKTMARAHTHDNVAVRPLRAADELGYGLIEYDAEAAHDSIEPAGPPDET